ncbi:MAG TPA: thiol reductant ABC exporter subunit CydC, partial [Spirochaetia bacterium]|nr:thiol reductant ABC exporter subunit CydC [Spirochaetia bacterium]
MRDLLRLVKLVRPHWKLALLGLFLSLATLLANLGLLALSSWFIASMALAGLAGALFDYTTAGAGVRALALGRAAGRYAERLVN